MTRNARIRFQPHDCVVCGRIHEPVILDAEKFYRWKVGGEHIQDVFPEMTKDQREILISGTCPECWDVLFPKEDEEVELENSRKDEQPTSSLEAERMERNRMDRMNGAMEIERLREEYKWDQRDLEQRAKDMEAIEKEDEEQRQKDLVEWYEALEEQNEFYCTDPFLPSFGNIFS